MIGQVDEVLREVNWKIHRRRKGEPNLHNLGRELADITKYVISLWQLFGFTAQDMLDFCIEKTIEMQSHHEQEFSDLPEKGSYVLICDIDGTIGDWRAAFIRWKFGKEASTRDTYETMAMDVQLNLPYTEYEEAKNKFEQTGQYRIMDPFRNTVVCLQRLNEVYGVQVHVFTARPAIKYSRTWSDAWSWLQRIEVAPHVKELHIGHEDRIAFACRLKENGCNVVMWDDDPTIALRAAHAGIPVFLKSYPYNEGIVHPNVQRKGMFNVDDFLHKLDYKHQETL